MTNNVENALKSKANFQEFVANNPLPTAIVDIVSKYTKTKAENLCKIVELTQNFESFLNLFEPTNPNSMKDELYIVWIVTNEKEKIMNFVEKVNSHMHNSGIFVIKVTPNDEGYLDCTCLAKPPIKKKPIKNLNSPASIIQKSYWAKYFEVCDELQSQMQIPMNSKPQHFQYISIGKSGVQIVQTISATENYVATELFINNDKTKFEHLLNIKTEIETALGTLDWHNKEGVKSSKIRKTEPFNLSDENNFEEACKKHINMAEEFKETFCKYL